MSDIGQSSGSRPVSAVSAARYGSASYGPEPDGDEQQPELADIGRLARRALRRAVNAARADDASIPRILRNHLGPGAAGFPVVLSTWPRYDQVNVQEGLGAWLAGQGREHHTVGLTSFRHQEFGLADLLQESPHQFGPRAGSVATVALPSGPGGLTRRCVQCAVYLITGADGRLALLVRGPDDHGPAENVTIEAVSAAEDRAQRALDDVRDLLLAAPPAARPDRVRRDLIDRDYEITRPARPHRHGGSGGSGATSAPVRPRSWAGAASRWSAP